MVIDVNAARSSGLLALADALTALRLCVTGLADSRRRFRRLAPHLAGLIKQPWYAGLRACFRQTLTAVWAARTVREVSVLGRVAALHANDLTAALAMVIAAPNQVARRTYDAHELEIHRNRRAGWLRVLIEHHYEARALAMATEARAVSRAIAQKMRAFHPTRRAEPQVVTNDFFEHHSVDPAPSANTPAIAYVGGSGRGRCLERLEGTSQDLGFRVHKWLLDGAAAQVQTNYERELLALARSTRTVMWCCVDPSSLSYRLALPNKLFQALAMSLPIIATPGTYLADIVVRHNIGAIDDGVSLRSLAARVQSDDYLEWVSCVLALRTAIREGSVEL
jgi:hypothetical protein